MPCPCNKKPIVEPYHNYLYRDRDYRYGGYRRRFNPIVIQQPPVIIQTPTQPQTPTQSQTPITNQLNDIIETTIRDPIFLSIHCCLFILIIIIGYILYTKKQNMK